MTSATGYFGNLQIYNGATNSTSRLILSSGLDGSSTTGNVCGIFMDFKIDANDSMTGVSHKIQTKYENNYPIAGGDERSYNLEIISYQDLIIRNNVRDAPAMSGSIILSTFNDSVLIGSKTGSIEKQADLVVFTDNSECTPPGVGTKGLIVTTGLYPPNNVSLVMGCTTGPNGYSYIGSYKDAGNGNIVYNPDGGDFVVRGVTGHNQFTLYADSTDGMCLRGAYDGVLYASLLIHGNGDSSNLNMYYGATQTVKISSTGSSYIGYTGMRLGLAETNPTYLLHLGLDSAAKPSTNTWTVPSDERIKTDIIDADKDDCLGTICSLKLREFAYKQQYRDKHGLPDTTKWGFIAQELESVAPYCVNTHKGIETWCSCPDQPKHLTNCQPLVIENLKTINTDDLNYAVFGAIQKLNERIERQDTDITQLKAEIESLKK